jgi:hypothetical protein
MEQMIDVLEVNGQKYYRAGTQSEPTIVGKRAVVVVDRGWIFAGDVTEENGRIKLSRAVWVFRWESIGFDGMLKDPKSKSVQLRKLDHVVDFPQDAEVFRCPVSDSWGL